MKKIILSTIVMMALCHTAATAQVEVKINPVGALFGTIDLTGE